MVNHGRLLLDVTATESSDLKTGIQRVTIELYRWLSKRAPSHVPVIPVYLRADNGRWRHWQANSFAHRTNSRGGQPPPDCPIEASERDGLLHLDLATTPVTFACQQGLYAMYRDRGARIGSIVYDLLPIQLPDCFPSQMAQHHQGWLEALATFDGALCISQDVASALRQWLLTSKHKNPDLHVDVFKLGSDIGTFKHREQRASTCRQPFRRPKLFGTQRAKTFLMVGTIEPRKGYDEALDAFEALWRQETDCRLIIVGREGWTHLPLTQRVPVTSLVRRLEQHPQRYRQLVWLSAADDEALELAYQQADCLLAASLGEGFGLPIIEAARRRVPVLARDIPVFREAAPTGTTFFTSDTLIQQLENWQPVTREHLSCFSHVTWQESATEVLNWLDNRGFIQQREVVCVD